LTTEEFSKISHTIPKEPGVYRFADEENNILYVGKAKNLKNRITSYFGNRKHQAYKTRVMVKNADHIDFTVVDSEQDALILENTLIKKYRPRYNVNFKDDKSYTYLVIKNERFPRVLFTREVIKDGSVYFGPYTSKWKMGQIFEVIKTLFPLRTCNFNLTEENILGGKFKLCLEYHIKNCLGPCENLDSEKEYEERIEQIINILKGNLKPVKNYMKNQMKNHVENLNFEKASEMKEKLEFLEDYQGKSTVVNQNIQDVDVFSMNSDGDFAYVNYLKIVNGLLIHSDTVELKKNLIQKNASILRYAVNFFREKYNSIAPELILQMKIEYHEDLIQTVPQRGDKHKLLQLSEKNVFYHTMQKKKNEILKIKKQIPFERILKTLQDDLNMNEPAYHIECFDNSNIQGTNAVASCVVFKNAKPSKKDYRKFNIKTVEGPDDFASMQEVVHRRYKRMLAEKKELPQLIIIDGGKGQLNAAIKSLEKLNLMDKIKIIGIAKRLEEIYMAHDPIPLYINKTSESLKLIQQLRNEAHRFAINFHRDKRSNSFLTTSLTDIEGIGLKTAQRLLGKFGSIKRLKNEDLENIAAEIGNHKANILKKFLNRND